MWSSFGTLAIVLLTSTKFEVFFSNTPSKRKVEVWEQKSKKTAHALNLLFFNLRTYFFSYSFPPSFLQAILPLTGITPQVPLINFLSDYSAAKFRIGCSRNGLSARLLTSGTRWLSCSRRLLTHLGGKNGSSGAVVVREFLCVSNNELCRYAAVKIELIADTMTTDDKLVKDFWFFK